MEESKRNAVGMSAGVQALRDQRNEALDRHAQTISELAATQAELLEVTKERDALLVKVATLAPKPEEQPADAGP